MLTDTDLRSTAFKDLSCDDAGVSSSGIIDYETWNAGVRVVPASMAPTVSSSLLDGDALPLTPLQQHLLPQLEANKDLLFLMRSHKVGWFPPCSQKRCL
jgi:hypothetical protein